MSKINILLLSDIHFKNTNPENEGKVLSAFFKDLNETMDVNRGISTIASLVGILSRQAALTLHIITFLITIIKSNNTW